MGELQGDENRWKMIKCLKSYYSKHLAINPLQNAPFHFRQRLPSSLPLSEALLNILFPECLHEVWSQMQWMLQPPSGKAAGKIQCFPHHLTDLAKYNCWLFYKVKKTWQTSVFHQCRIVMTTQLKDTHERRCGMASESDKSPGIMCAKQEGGFWGGFIAMS